MKTKTVSPGIEPIPAPVLVHPRGLAVRVPAGQTIALRARPGGRVLTRIAARTEFGSAQTLAVAAKKGGWIAVRSPALGNKQIGWVDTRRTPLRLLRRALTLRVSLRRRELDVYSKRGLERRIRVAVGAPATPTPPGTYYVTDKLPGAEFGSYYGCCVLALSGRQPNLPRGWSGGDRLAIHGAPTATWGHAVSNGCLHASEADLRYLMKTVSLGTEVIVSEAGTPPAPGS